MGKYPVFFTLPRYFTKPGFYLKQPVLWCVCLSLACVIPISLHPLSCGSLLLISVLGSWFGMVTGCHGSDTMKGPQWTRLAKIAPMKANRDINEPTLVLPWSPWRLCTFRYQFVCIGLSCQTKWHESYTSEDHRNGEYKEKDILKRKAKVWRYISMVYFYLCSTSSTLQFIRKSIPTLTDKSSIQYMNAYHWNHTLVLK